MTVSTLVIATVGTILFYFIGQVKNVDFSFAYNSLVFAYLLFAATYRYEKRIDDNNAKGDSAGT